MIDDNQDGLEDAIVCGVGIFKRADENAEDTEAADSIFQNRALDNECGDESESEQPDSK